MKTVTPEEILFLHDRIIETTGGRHGVRDVGALLACTERPWSGLKDRMPDPGLWEKAAALLECLIRRHPFVDGNKRTAFAAAVLMLESNGHVFHASATEIVAFVVDIARGIYNVASIASWLKRRCHAKQ